MISPKRALAQEGTIGVKKNRAPAKRLGLTGSLVNL